jgi:hypothetical protein
MCNPTNTPRSTNTLMLTSLKSFGEDAKGQTPSTSAKLFTIGAFIVFLTIMEQLCRLVLLQYSVCLTTTTTIHYYVLLLVCIETWKKPVSNHLTHTIYIYISFSLCFIRIRTFTHCWKMRQIDSF